MALNTPVPAAIAKFLDTPTPVAWVDEACERVPEMLLDHANCELKAASTALGFLYRYPERTALVQRMSRLAREELRHFEQVRSIMDDLGIPFARLSASRYAGGLREAVPMGTCRRTRMRGCAAPARKAGPILWWVTRVRGTAL